MHDSPKGSSDDARARFGERMIREQKSFPQYSHCEGIPLWTHYQEIEVYDDGDTYFDSRPWHLFFEPIQGILYLEWHVIDDGEWIAEDDPHKVREALTLHGYAVTPENVSFTSLQKKRLDMVKHLGARRENFGALSSPLTDAPPCRWEVPDPICKDGVWIVWDYFPTLKRLKAGEVAIVFNLIDQTIQHCVGVDAQLLKKIRALEEPLWRDCPL